MASHRNSTYSLEPFSQAILSQLNSCWGWECLRVAHLEEALYKFLQRMNERSSIVFTTDEEGIGKVNASGNGIC